MMFVQPTMPEILFSNWRSHCTPNGAQLLQLPRKKRVGLGGTAKIHAGKTVDLWAAGAGKGGAGGMRRGGERSERARGGRGEAPGLAGWPRFAHMGGATKRRAARTRPHVGDQKNTLASFFHRKQTNRTWDSVCTALPCFLPSLLHL
jgi:hypothetical protein